MKKENKGLKIAGKAEISRIERFVEEICDYHNISNDYFGNILLATTEAAEILFSLNDGIGHEQLEILFDRNRNGLIFTIRLVNGVQSATDTEDILDREIRRHKLSKDLFIVQSLADEITISVNARRIMLTFYVTSMNFEKSLDRITKLKDYWLSRENVIQKK